MLLELAAGGRSIVTQTREQINAHLNFHRLSDDSTLQASMFGVATPTTVECKVRHRPPPAW